MFKSFHLALVCCSLTSLALATNRFIIKYQPSLIQSQVLAKGGAAAKAVREQMMKPLSAGRVKILSATAGINVKEVNQIATGAHVVITEQDMSETDTKNFMDDVQKEPMVEYIEEDRIVKPVTVKEAHPGWQWGVFNLGEFAVEPSWNGDGFFAAWTALDAAGYGVGTNVVVGVIDTGYTPHPNFLSALQQLGSTNGVYGYQFISDCRISGQCSPSTLSPLAVNYPYQADALDQGDYVSQSDIQTSNGFFTPDCLSATSSWHGSHVTGIIAANGYTAANPSYIAGGAYGATVVPVRVLGKCGGYISDVTNGMLWAAGLNVSSNGVAVPVNPNPVQVMNLSLGGSGACTKTEQDTINTINVVTQNGTIIVVAAGNDQVNINSFNPSGCSGVIVVGAKGPTNSLAFYSNYGATTITASGGDSNILGCYTGSNGKRICPSSIYSTIWSSAQAYSSSGLPDFAFYQGTSMATPQVVAAVADIISVFKAKNQNYTLYGITSILQQTAKAYTNCNLFGCAGTSTLDAAAAITYALQNSAPTAPPATAPLVSTSGASGGGGGGGGGCSAINNGDDYSLILLLVFGSSLYAYRRRKVFKK